MERRPDLTAPYPVLGAAARIGPGGPQGDLKASAGVWEGRSDEFGESRAQHVSGLTIDLNSPGSSQRSHVTLTMPTRGPEQATIEAETITCIENMNEAKRLGSKVEPEQAEVARIVHDGLPMLTTDCLIEPSG